MSRFGARSSLDWLEGELVNVTPTRDGGMELTPDDLSPNRNWRAVSASGEPELWEVLLPEVTAGHHTYASPPGGRNPGAGVPEEETQPPRADLATRQTAAAVGIGDDAWTGNRPRATGLQPIRSQEFAASIPKPDAPEVMAVAVDKRGFAADDYAVLFDLREKGGGSGAGGRTTPSGPAFLAVGQNQGIRFFVGEGYRGAQLEMGVYVTRPGSGGNTATARRQEVIDLSRLAEPYVDITGPYKDRGKRPATQNESGVRSRTPRLGRDVRRKPSPKRFDLQPGRYRFGYQKYKEGRGWGLVSDVSDEWIVGEEQKDRCFAVYPPEDLKPDEGWRPWVLKDNVPHYVYTRKEPGTVYGPAHGAIPIHGYAPDAEPGGMRFGLYQTEMPAEDESALEAPDPTSGPDQPRAIGVPTWSPVPADYAFMVSGATETGEESLVSDVARNQDGEPWVRIGANQVPRVAARPTVNVLKNAEGSERAPDGTAADLTYTNCGPSGAASATARATVADGVFTLDAQSTLSSGLPLWEFARYELPDGPDSVITITGRMACLRHTAGTGRLVLREYDDAGAILATHVLMSLSALGAKTLQPLGVKFGSAGGGTAFQPDTARVGLVMQGVLAGGSWNQKLTFSDLAIFPFGAALWKSESLGPGQPANLNPPPATPFPTGSAFALGPAPTPAGPPPAAEAPLALLDFEGMTAGQAPSATGWTFSKTPNGAVSVVEAAAALAGSLGWRVQDDTTGTKLDVFGERTFATGTSLHLRMLLEILRLPTKGEAILGYVFAGGSPGTAMAQVRITSGGQLRLYYVKPDGSLGSYVAGSSGLRNGTLLDLELGVTGGGTKNGRMSLSAGTGGNARTPVASRSGLDFSGRSPARARVAVRETDAGAKCTLRLDNVVVTRAGDVLDRESPQAQDPQGGQPAPDAPSDGAGGYRLFDADGAAINQFRWFVEPESEPGPWGPKYRDDVYKTVKPGQLYTHALYARYEALEEPETPTLPFLVTLEGPGKEPLQMGSPFGAAMAGSSGWADRWHTVEVPEREDDDDPGYTRARISCKDVSAMVGVGQEHLFAEGNLSTQAQRDAARDYGRKTSGTARVTLDSRLEHGEFTPDFGQRWVSFGVAPSAELAAPNAATILYRSGPTEAGPWSAETADPSAVPSNKVLQVSLALSGDGEDGPSFAADSVYLETRWGVGVLLDRNRRPLSGLLAVPFSPTAYDRADQEITIVDGHPYSEDIGDEIERLGPFTVVGYTTAAASWLKGLTPRDEVVLEDPVAGPTGTVYTLRFYDVLEVEERPFGLRRFEGMGRVLVSCETPGAEVLESSPMGWPRAF